MTAPYPVGFIGNGMTRVVTLALPSLKVRAFLPAGLELGPQEVTPPGTHPVIFLFHGFSECQWSFPTLLRSMKFHEQTVGVPFTHVMAGHGPGREGPYYFMPKLYLDDLFVRMSGLMLWGFDKEMASINVTAERYTVTGLNGRRLASLAWSANGNDQLRAIAGYPAFEPVRHMLSQTLISAFPAAIGPLFALTDFDRRWNLARVRPLRTVLEVDSSYMPFFEGGRYPPLDGSENVDSFPLGSWELSGPWWLSFPYRPLLPLR